MRIRSTLASLVIGVFIGLGVTGAQSAVSYLNTPLDPGNWLNNLNLVIQQVNSGIGNYISLSSKTGEMQFSATQSWATNSNVATTMTSLGPQGASTTVSRWLVVVDNQGNAGVIPWYKITP